MTRLFYRDKPIIGLDISSTGVKFMSVDSRRWLVEGYGTLDLEPLKLKASLEEGDPYLGQNLKVLLKDKIIGEIGSNRAVVGIPTERSYSRTFTMPSSTEKNLTDAVLLEVEQYVPVSSDMLYIDSQVIERNRKTITVLMSAVPKAIVDNVIAATAAAKLDTIMIEPSINAVGRVLLATEDGSLPTVIVDVGSANTDIAILDGGVVRITSGLSIGGNTFTLEIAQKMGVSLEQAHQLKVLNGLNAGPRQEKITAALTPSLDRIVDEVRKVMRYYQERITDRKLEQLLVVGNGSNIPGIGDYFTNALVMPARSASPWQRLDFGKLQNPPKQARSRYISVAGLASVKPEVIWK